MPTWETQGSHRLYRQDDLLFFELHGMFELPDVQRMYAITDDTVQAYGYILTLFDASAATGITVEARRYVGEKSKASPNEGAAAIIGASFPIRTLITLLRNASRLIGRPMPPMQFFATPADGLKWLATQGSLFQIKLNRHR